MSRTGLWENAHRLRSDGAGFFFRGASGPSINREWPFFALCNISYVTDTNESWCLTGHLWLTSALTWHLLCCAPLLSLSEVRSPKCRAGTAAAGCSRCRTDWTSAGASGWLSPLSQGEAWRCTSYYSRSSHPARTAHKRRKQEKVTGQTKYEVFWLELANCLRALFKTGKKISVRNLRGTTN